MNRIGLASVLALACLALFALATIPGYAQAPASPSAEDEPETTADAGEETPSADQPEDADRPEADRATEADEADTDDAAPEAPRPRRPAQREREAGSDEADTEQPSSPTRRRTRRVPTDGDQGAAPDEATDEETGARERRRTRRAGGAEETDEADRPRRGSEEDADRGEDAGRQDFGAGIEWSTDDENRLVISSIEENSRLARAGIRERDVIISVNGRRVADRDGFLRWFRRGVSDEPLVVVILRDGRSRTIELDVGAEFEAGRSDRFSFDDPGQAEIVYEGAERAALGVVLDLRYPNDAVVERVYRDSPADRAGIRPGDVIISFNGRELYSPQHLMSLVSDMEPGTEVEIEYSRRVTRTTATQLGSREVLREGAMPLTQERQQREGETYEEVIEGETFEDEPGGDY
jgi:hypothetical protein